MKRQKPTIGHAIQIDVHWYDRVPEPPREIEYAGEIIGWRDSQVIVRIKDYAVVRFWKESGLEVGNPDHERRGFKIDLLELQASLKPAQGVNAPLNTIDTDA